MATAGNREGEESAASTPAADSVRDTYGALAEPDKRLIAKTVEKGSPEVFAEWARRAGLGGKGFRPRVVAQRGKPHYGDKLDRVLLKPSNERLFEDVLGCFFQKYISGEGLRLFEHVVATCNNGETSTSEPKQVFRDAARTVPEAFPDDSLAPLFALFAEWSPPDFADQLVRPTPPVPADPPGTSDTEVANWLASVSSLTTLADALVEAAERLRSALPIDESEINEVIREGCATSTALREQLEEAARQSVFGGPQWHDPEGLAAYCRALGDHLQTKSTEDADNRRRLEALATHLSACSMCHRSSRRQATLDDLRTQVVAELHHGAQAEDVVVLPGPGGAEEWLEWAFFQADAELDALVASLEGSLPRLSEFLESAELDWLAVSEALASERDTREPAALDDPGGGRHDGRRWTEDFRKPWCQWAREPATDRAPRRDTPAAPDRRREREGHCRQL